MSPSSASGSSFEIRVDAAGQLRAPGQTVTGRLDFGLGSSVVIKRVCLEVVGLEEGKWGVLHEADDTLDDLKEEMHIIENVSDC